jgi:ABC-2 type transport system ATP-binding protein
VDGISLEVPVGAILGFLGPNGSGKTTTIRLLLGLLEPSRGTATVLGYDTRVDGASIRERSGALLEHSGLYERLSARDNLDFYARVGISPGPSGSVVCTNCSRVWVSGTAARTSSGRGAEA